MGLSLFITWYISAAVFLAAISAWLIRRAAVGMGIPMGPFMGWIWGCDISPNGLLMGILWGFLNRCYIQWKRFKHDVNNFAKKFQFLIYLVIVSLLLY